MGIALGSEKIGGDPVHSLYELIYVSKAVRLLAEEELLDLLDTSRRRNDEHKISGLLLYSGGNFLQIIEGEQSALKQLYRNIRADGRHEGVMQLVFRPIKHRRFLDWQMAYRHLEGEQGAQLQSRFRAMNRAEDSTADLDITYLTGLIGSYASLASSG